MERARSERLTRNQHVLLRLGEWIAYAECAGALARRAAAAQPGTLPDKAEARFDAAGLAALARVFARGAALKVAGEGLQCVVGAGGVPASQLAGFEQALGTASIHAAQAGLLADMDTIANALYDRASA
jgi:alkylation response protein AidB-like acyl-CoA dehydrogenase